MDEIKDDTMGSSVADDVRKSEDVALKAKGTSPATNE